MNPVTVVDELRVCVCACASLISWAWRMHTEHTMYYLYRRHNVSDLCTMSAAPHKKIIQYLNRINVVYSIFSTM